jgi:3-isopropylmalate/(R)-2-methylmalate dehydratase small subunit
MEPITTITGTAIPLGRDDVDTDRMIPIRFLRRPLSDGYGNFLFRDDRFDAEGREITDFVFNQAPYRKGTILIGGKNFGCGSAREGAVYAVRDYGIRAVIAAGFADIFSMNCCWNGVLPVVLPGETIAKLCDQVRARPGATLTIDLPHQTVTGPDGVRHTFTIDPAVKQQLMAGLDDVDATLQFKDKIEGFEQNYLRDMPWIARV